MRRVTIPIIYLTGLAQGFALVVVPAASSLLTDPHGYGFSGAAYGALFIPMVAAAVAASASGGVLALRWGLKRVLLAGLLLDVVAMGLVASSAFFMGRPSPSYVILLAAMLALGGGFGSTLTAINRLAPASFPDHAEPALTALHALLGTGTALAPVLVSAAAGAGWWWIPALVAGVALALMLAAMTQPFTAPGPAPAAPRGGPRTLLREMSPTLWGFVAVVVLYGVCETLYGNWAIVYLHADRGLSARTAGLALAVFWAMVTVGRVVIAVGSAWVPPRWIYRALPVVLIGSFLAVSRSGTAGAALVVFGAGGLACSAFLPLSVSFAETGFPALAELMAGELMAAYMIGYGIAAFAVGPLVDAGVASLGAIYLGASVVAAGMLALAYGLTRRADAG
ncbi:MAG TPA: MFS transporter [Gemmatimonadales bacterium]|nr:MFS transporter [Gemmatimonadales bacterium]